MVFTKERIVDPLAYRKGTSWSRAWKITEAGANIDLTAGWSAKGQIRDFRDATAVLYEWSSAAGTILLTDSRVTLLLSPAVSATWTWREGVYDVLLTDPTGQVFPVSEGSFTLRSGPTHG